MRFLLRSWLALVMIGDGIVKAIPVQMPAPGVADLLLPLGDLTPARLLWTFMGASPIFQSFAGLAELLGGVLLLLPRTTLLGALICAANLLTAVVVSLCYGLPVTLYLFFLLLASVFLAVPDLGRLVNLLFFNRAVEPAAPPPRLFERKWRDRAPQVLLVLVALVAMGRSFVFAADQYRRNHPPRPPYYGIWLVEEISVDGDPVLTEMSQWRWVIFENPGVLEAELMVGARKRYALELDVERKAMRIGRRGGGELRITEPEPDVLHLEGKLDGRRTWATLRKMQLLGDRFHWILEPEEEE
ncbi:MAG TPA: hypothetical protein VE078_07680 [Thermoanaerobaculia bacterium]|nr:hypothetical protein [Thermoanaerobaculia bacterium]